MKVVVGKLASFAAVALLICPLSSFAQNIASRPGAVDRSVERYTLLTGPTLLAPAHGFRPFGPTVNLGPVQSGQTPPREFRFLPRLPKASGTLSLGGSNHAASAPLEPPKSRPLPQPESLRFDSSLQSGPKLQLSK